MNSTIHRRMKETCQTFEQVTAELETMKAAAARYATGNLTDADRAEVKRFTRDFNDRGGPCWRGR